MLLRPLITEKTMAETKVHKFAFMVDVKADKTSIKKMVEKLFSVHVVGVQTMNKKGKAYRTGKRWKYAYKPDEKKAIVSLKSGETIDLFDVRNPEPETVQEAEVIENIETGEKIKTPKKGKK